MRTSNGENSVILFRLEPFLIAQADQRILDWAQTTLQAPVAALSAPQRTSTSAVSLYLTDILIEPTNRNERRHVLQASLRYLVTVNADNPEKAHGLLETLLESAIDNPDFIVEAEQPSAEFWLALGVPPQPCLRVRVRAIKEIPLRPLRYSQDPLRDQHRPGTPGHDRGS